MKSWKRWIILILGLAVSGLFVTLALQGLHLQEVWVNIREAKYIWLLPGVIIYFGAVWARTWRWKYLLRPMKEVSQKQLFPIVVIGYMGNNIYPFRAGEVIRAWVLRRNEGISISASLATIFIERIFDGLVMLIFVFAALPFAPVPAPFDRIVLWMTFLFFGTLAAFFFFALKPDFTKTIYTKILTALFKESKMGKGLLDFADKFMTGLASLRSPRDLLMILISSILIWLTETTKYYFVMHAFNFSVSFFVLMLMTAIVNLATTLPSSPGYVGTFDEPGIEILKVFGVEANTAAAYTFVLHAALWLPITLLGIYYMIRQGVKWEDFSRARGEASATTESVTANENERD